MLWLERKYLSQVVSLLDMGKWTNDNTLNHRCPYCGDSQKNKHKARGYHFAVQQSFIYKCHNCGKSTSSVKFLKDHFPVVYKEYIKEWLSESGKKPRTKKTKSANDFKFTPRTDVLNKIDIDLSTVCDPAWDVEIARTFLQNRKIPDDKIKDLWFVEDAKSLQVFANKRGERGTKWIRGKHRVHYDVKGADDNHGNIHENLGDHTITPAAEDQRIVIPFYSKDGELIGVTGRAINKKTNLRYLTLRFVDDVPLVYNYDKVDTTKTVIVTEGPIDSLFLPNSIAIAGSDYRKLKDLDAKLQENAILVFDNETRNEHIIKKVSSAIDEGYRVCIWDDRRVADFKDVNEMILGGLSADTVADIITSNAYSGLSAKTKLSEYKKI